MNDPREEILIGVSEALADGLPVDWEGLGRGEPALAEDLGPLRGVEEMASAFRAVREAAGEGEPPGGAPAKERD